MSSGDSSARAARSAVLASDTRLERDVVIAVLKVTDFNDQTLARFEREARTLARLGDHPNIVSVFDIGEEQGHPYIVAQFVDGGSLDALRKSAPGRRLPVRRGAANRTTGVPGPAVRAHAGRRAPRFEAWECLVHQRWNGQAGRFWARGRLGFFPPEPRRRAPGTVYMAPEQALGQFADARSDIYSFGVTLYELMAGRLPFVGDTLAAIVSQHLHAPPSLRPGTFPVFRQGSIR